MHSSLTFRRSPGAILLGLLRLLAETIPGGVYLVGGRYVDANGNEVKNPEATAEGTEETEEADGKTKTTTRKTS